MESILTNEIRVGNFTSSQMHRLVSNGVAKGSVGKPFISYVAEKKRERRLGRSLKIEKNSRATLWGKFLEEYVHELLPMGYEYISSKSIQHPTIKEWVGSPDNRNVMESVVADTKCYEPDNFCQYVDCLSEAVKNNDTETFKKEHPEEYWQLVSNAIIIGADFIEAIVFMPYESELPDIRQMAENYDNFDQYRFRFISESPKEELPYLIDGGYYKNLNIFRFKVPQADKDLLTLRVQMAIQLINKP